jgi:hypothetical protein
MRHDELPHKHCENLEIHNGHRNLFGPEPTWCPGFDMTEMAELQEIADREGWEA